MKEVLEQHKLQAEEYCRRLAENDEQRRKIYERIKRAEAQLAKLDRQRDKLHMPRFYDLVVELAKRLEKHFDMPYEIYGPFGLNCETSIYLRKDMKKRITEQGTWSITLRPLRGGWMQYDTGKRVEIFPRGSIGWLNNDNSIFAELPVDFDEIIKLVKWVEHSE